MSPPHAPRMAGMSGCCCCTLLHVGHRAQPRAQPHRADSLAWITRAAVSPGTGVCVEELG